MSELSELRNKVMSLMGLRREVEELKILVNRLTNNLRGESSSNKKKFSELEMSVRILKSRSK